jgi:hypothetical protein
MPRRTRASSRTPRPRPRTEPAPAALAPSVPPVEFKANDYTLGSPDFAEPKLAVWVSTENFTEWMILSVRIRDHFVSEEKRTGRRVLKKDGVPYIMQCEPPPGEKITKHMAEELFTICRKVADMSGGLLPDKENN